MRTRQLGPTDLHITPIGFGAQVSAWIGAAEFRLSDAEIAEIETRLKA